MGIKRTIRSQTFRGYFKPKERNVRAAEEVEIIEILQACTNTRDQLLLLMIAETGFRIGEILGVDYTRDIDYQRKTVRVYFRDDNENEARAKNAEHRRARISDETFEFLLSYLNEYRELLQRGTFLFINIEGDRAGKPMMVGSVYDMLKRMEKKTGHKITPHMLRRYFARSRRQENWNLEMISMALGHKHLDTTIKYLGKYLRYGIGIANLSISSLRTEFLVVRKFLGDMNQPETENICMVTEQQMDAWLRSEQQREVQADTFNKKVMCILHFFQYLQIKDYITAIPFDPNYYLKKTFMQHHDRSVAQETMDQIRRNLYRFPEEVRLMYLHLWGVGLRISEVCTLKGNAYYLQGKDAWIQVYQIKMRTYKRIPIPMTLYRLMQVYITKYKRKTEEYIFQNRNGGAYRKTTFQQTMKRLCEECNIQNGEYLFKSHDYRHTLATTFYDAGVPIQSIRDYLGHEYEEMTLQYLDYMPKRIENANEEYFKRKSLASCLRKGVENGEQNLYQENDTVQSDCVDETAGEVYNWGPVL